jgi:YD repeat-containing protein
MASVWGDIAETVGALSQAKDITDVVNHLGNTQELNYDAVGLLTSIAVDSLCNFGLGVASIPDGGAALAIGEIGCTSLATLAGNWATATAKSNGG